MQFAFPVSYIFLLKLSPKGSDSLVACIMFVYNAMLISRLVGCLIVWLVGLDLGATPGGAQQLPLALGTLWDAGDRTGSTTFKADTLPSILSLQPAL